MWSLLFFIPVILSVQRVPGALYGLCEAPSEEGDKPSLYETIS